MKFQSTKVTFAEVPDEITLCIEIAGCPLHCSGCHSPWLWEDKGQDLTIDRVKELLDTNPGITCICFMGGIPEEVEVLVKWTRQTGIKVAWYTGLEEKDIPNIDLRNFDYIKVGPYIAEKGPLNNPGTNQRFYRVRLAAYGGFYLEDLTYKFWQSSVVTAD